MIELCVGIFMGIVLGGWYGFKQGALAVTVRSMEKKLPVHSVKVDGFRVTVEFEKDYGVD